jgi:DNA-binding NarL/FixJ family response regulator
VAAAQTGVLLIDDHRAFTEALAIALEHRPGLRCRGVAHTVEAGLQLAATTDDVHVAVVDLDIPATGGLAAISRLRESRPGIAVVVLTAHPRPDLADTARAEGAVGFLGKDASLDEIADTVRRAAGGAPIARRAEDPSWAAGLSPREIEVLRCLGRGLDAARVTEHLGISLYTTRDHIRSILSKLDVRTQLEAVVTADRLGIITVSMGF